MSKPEPTASPHRLKPVAGFLLPAIHANRRPLTQDCGQTCAQAKPVPKYSQLARGLIVEKSSVSEENITPDAPSVAELQAEIERLKGHQSKLLDETKTAKQRAQELEKAQQDAEIARQHEQGEYKSLAEKYRADADAAAKALLEMKGGIANKELDATAMQVALVEANSPANAKILARFIRDQLEYGDGAVMGKGGKSAQDAVKELFATGEYESLRKGLQSSGGGAPGSKTGGGAAGNMGGSKAERQAAIAKRFNLPAN